MSEPFLGEIKIMAFGYAPRNWAMCNGQFLPINQNQALFSLLGTMYGGNGQTTFALPDLRGQTPIHFNKNTQGTKGGEKAHTLSLSELPTHQHALNGTTAADSQIIPGSAMLGTSAATDPIYANPASLVAMDPTSISNVGGSQAHENMQPFLTLNFCIALIGIFPSQN
ncbi:MAG TPA: tail fiber protein [Chthoniobacterales bacterium]|nr:tail fiber protein [Chthoniobacterales bacterium]